MTHLPRSSRRLRGLPSCEFKVKSGAGIPDAGDFEPMCRARTTTTATNTAMMAAKIAIIFISFAQRKIPLLLLLAEGAETQPELNRIDPWIRRSKSRVRNVHVADLRADIVLGAKEVQSQRGAAREIHVGRAFRNFSVGEERAAADFKIRSHAMLRVQHPFECERIQSRAIGRVRFLKNPENGNCINRVLKSAAEKSRAVRRSKNPSIAQADIPDSVARLAAADAVASASPDLPFVAAFDGASLRANCRRTQKRGEEEGRKNVSHRGVSLNFLDAGIGFPVLRRYRKSARKANFCPATGASFIIRSSSAI